MLPDAISEMFCTNAQVHNDDTRQKRHPSIENKDQILWWKNNRISGKNMLQHITPQP